MSNLTSAHLDSCHRAYYAAVAADAAYSLELQRTYGREACNARYDARGRATPTLAKLAAAKVAADDARRAAMRAA